jgi:hypothetical protein
MWSSTRAGLLGFAQVGSVSPAEFTALGGEFQP